MNKLLLLCITLFVITHNANGQTIAGVEIRERTVGGLNTCQHTYSSTGFDSPTNANDVAQNNLPTTCTIADGTAPCTGTGAILSVLPSGGEITESAITVVAAGSGYKVDDIILVAKELILKSDGAATDRDLKIKLVAGDLGDNLLRCGHTGSGFTGPTDADEANNAVLTLATGDIVHTGASGTGAALKLYMKSDGTTVIKIEVTSAGTGYQIGDEIKVIAAKFTGTVDGTGATTTDFVWTLTYADFQDLGKLTVTGGFRDSEGAITAFNQAVSKTGYYTTLSKNANAIQVKVTLAGTGTVTAELDGVTDTALVSAVYSGQIFTVKDGFNILKLTHSVTGIHEFNLIKPDDYVKTIKMSKRSVEISYNPGAVGEFTCSAFADRSALPSTRDNVKTGTGSVAKSVRTHNILPENRYNSVQMTLNGLAPSTIYDIHCFHLSHGIISNTAASVETDLGSLTGVSLEPGATTGGATPSTLTLKFTHETSLASGFTVKLVLYNDYDTAQTVASAGTNSGADCGLQITTETSGGLAIAGSHSCAVSTQAPDTNNLLTLTINGPSNVASGTRGTEVILVLTDDGSELDLANNPVTGSVVTFDLVVDGHGPLLQQDGFITT